MKRLNAFACVVFGLSVLASFTGDLKAGELKAGYVAVNITPPAGIPMAGYYYIRKAEGTHDELLAALQAVAKVDLVSRLKDERLNFPQTGELHVFIPDVHLITAARRIEGGYQYGSLPRYFVYGGLVFTPLSLDYLRTLGRSATDASNADLYYELYYRRAENPSKARPEPIVLASVLADAVNANVTIRGHALIDRINGTRIEKLDDAIRAFESNTNTHDVVEFTQHHNLECLDRAEVALGSRSRNP